MTENHTRFPIHLTKIPAHLALTFFIGAALISSGCSARKRPSIAWASAVQARPALQSRATASRAPEEAAPEFNLDVPPFASVLIPLRSSPPRPHVSVAPPGSAGSETEKTAAPMIAPQLTPQETVAAQQETNQSLGIAEKNLAAARGKKLNAAQADLISKINGFLKDAREAAQTGDWSRARSLAKKAQVLSEELIGSF
jgi:hypothetical protein